MSVFLLDMCSSRHLVNNWISIAWAKYLYFKSIRHCDVEILATWYTCVPHRNQDIFFQTQKTIPTLTHDIALVHGQEVFYRHFESHETTLSCDLYWRCHQQTCVSWSIDNFVENLFVQHTCQENFHIHSCLTTTDPCLLFEGQVLTDFIDYVGDLLIHFLLIFRHTHTFTHSGTALIFIHTLRGGTLDW